MACIVLQGAVPDEIDLLVAHFPGGAWVKENGYSFYETPDSDVVISLTDVGIINAALSTMTAIRRYAPACVINQGTAGGHTPALAPGDIVIGSSSVHIANVRNDQTGGWRASVRAIPYEADPRLVAAAQAIPYAGKLVVGRLGAGDQFSRDSTWISTLRGIFGHLTEDMESAAVYQACAACGVPVIGIRVVSNNELTEARENRELFNRAQRALQPYIIDYISHLRTTWEGMK